MVIKEKQTKRQKLYKKTPKNKKQNDTTATEKKKKESAEAWTRTACIPGSLLVYWATEENTMDYVKNIEFKAYFFELCPLTP